MIFQSCLLKQDFNITTQQSGLFGNLNGSRCLRILMNFLSYLIRECPVFNPFIVESSRRPIHWQVIQNSSFFYLQCVFTRFQERISMTTTVHVSKFTRFIDNNKFENQGLNMTHKVSFDMYLYRPARVTLQLQVSLKSLQTPSRLASQVGPPETSMHLV